MRVALVACLLFACGGNEVCGLQARPFDTTNQCFGSLQTLDICESGPSSKGISVSCAISPDGAFYGVYRGTLMTLHSDSWRFDEVDLAGADAERCHELETALGKLPMPTCAP